MVVEITQKNKSECAKNTKNKGKSLAIWFLQLIIFQSIGIFTLPFFVKSISQNIHIHTHTKQEGNEEEEGKIHNSLMFYQAKELHGKQFAVGVDCLMWLKIM